MPRRTTPPVLACLAALAIVLPWGGGRALGAGGAQGPSEVASPAPPTRARPARASAQPAFTLSGAIRAYYFGRTNGNACPICTPKGQPDATAFSAGGYVRARFDVPHSPWSAGATYFGAYPFGLDRPAPHGGVGYNPAVDNSLPGYPLSVLGEAFLQYENTGTFAQAGRQIVRSSQSPWTPSSDTRITPTAFSGVAISTRPTPDLTLGVMSMARFRSRITSAFNPNTLLTSCDTAFPSGKGSLGGAAGAFTVPGDVCFTPRSTGGFSMFQAGYAFDRHALVSNAYQYNVIDLVSMTWLTAQYDFDPSTNAGPSIAAHVLDEHEAGAALLGTIRNHTWGGALGLPLRGSLNLTIGYDAAAAVRFVVPATACKGAASSPASPAPGAVFGGVPDVTDRAVPKGDVACYGGGIASPYTIGYTSDPLSTTSLTQGMPEVLKPGTAIKATLGWQSEDRRLRAYASQAWYDYSLPGATASGRNGDARSEFDLDAWYFFSRPPDKGAYRGFSLRQRYGDRSQQFSPFEFKSSRTQLEYDFSS